MNVVTTINALQLEIQQLKGKTIGFVPTMGFLHTGHLSLVEEARKENDVVVMSIFVNPLQFGPNEDFERYPRDEDKDTLAARKAGVDILFIPPVKEMYPEEMGIHLTVSKGTDVLCGKLRPGHFNGVATVLSKLFHLIGPTNSYFGLKDAQQFAVVHTLVTQLNFPVTIIGLPTVREKDGLAKSSRNVYLSEAEREEAIALHRSLLHGQKLIQEGQEDPNIVEIAVRKYLEQHTNKIIEYVSVLNYPDLSVVNHINQPIIIAIAVLFEKARLIDNIILQSSGKEIKRI